MRDYIDWMLEEQEEREEIPLPRWGTPLGKGGKKRREDEGTMGERNHPVGAADSPLDKGGEVVNPQFATQARMTALGGDGEDQRERRRPDEVVEPYRKGAALGSTAALRAKLRRTETAAGYRAATPHPVSADATFPSRGGRGPDTAELDAAFRRDARRFDGGFTLF